jgi:hypothetical protein
MLLIAEILLTISAWKKGWKARALLPVAIGMGIAFMVGAAAGANGVDSDGIVGVCILIDIAMVVSLIVMTAKAPAAAKEADEHQEAEDVLMKRNAA